jgi:pyruvate dehydrogenase E2 component (dihydrolipoamide acetyltransferase)
MPLTRIRRAGAKNLHRAWLNVPHVTQHNEADVTKLEEFRRSLKPEAADRGIKVTPLAFIMKACFYALKEYPIFNASLAPDGKSLILKKYWHIGMAVDTPEGLVVPVVKDVDQKGIWDLAEEIIDLSVRARDKKLKAEEMQGGTFSISSLGPIGGVGFTPIVNAPEVAILGVSNLATKPQGVTDEFVPRQMLPVPLSYDHRAINGAEAGRFCTYLCGILSDVRRLVL